MNQPNTTQQAAADGFELDPYAEFGPVTHEIVKASDAVKLRLLADWFDARDRLLRVQGTEVQDDLRRIAGLLTDPTTPEQAVIDAAKAWVDRIEEPPASWADDWDFELIAAVDRLTTTKEQT